MSLLLLISVSSLLSIFKHKMHHGDGAQEWRAASPPGGGEGGLCTPRRALHLSPAGGCLAAWLMSQHWGRVGRDVGASEPFSGASDTQAAVEQPLLLL